MADIFSNMGNTYYTRLNNIDLAIENYTNALSLWQKIGNISDEAKTHLEMSRIYYWKEDYNKWEYHLNKAKPLFESQGNNERLAEITGQEGLHYSIEGNRQKALGYIKRAITYTQAIEHPEIKAIELSRAGLVYSSIPDYQEALKYYEQALKLYQEIGDKGGEADRLASIAEIKQKMGNVHEAQKDITEAISIIENLRQPIVSHDIRTSYFSTVHRYYQLNIDILMQLHQKDPLKGYNTEAFHVSERSRTRTLVELLDEAKIDIRKDADPNLLEKESTLQNKFNELEKQLLDEKTHSHSKDKENSIKEERKNLLSELKNIQERISKASPHYAALTQQNPSELSLNLSEVQQHVLDSDTVLLQYYLGKENSYLWAVTQEKMMSYQIPSQEKIKKLTNKLRQAILHKVNAIDDIAKAASQLSQMILYPAADMLNKKRILVVADEVLQYIPFSVLSLPQSQQPLITRYEIVHLPSSSSLAILRKNLKTRKEAPKTLAVFADPVFSQKDKRVKDKQSTSSVQQILYLKGLKRLPGTRREAKAILELVPDSMKSAFFGFEANLSHVKSPQLSQYRIVHFATHGIIDTTIPELSRVVLSLVDEKGNFINGFLRLHEIYNLNLRSELVVISACKTGLGKEIKGEGMVGLTGGFMYAGSPRVLVSLWKVRDRATAEIMKRFYQLMIENKLPPITALRQAQLAMQRETQWKSPYYWAAFILQGEWQ
jgi:CHAT domain-containing protein/tetratricopeptide (TPR) repeat protein